MTTNVGAERESYILLVGMQKVRAGIGRKAVHCHLQDMTQELQS